MNKMGMSLLGIVVVAVAAAGVQPLLAEGDEDGGSPPAEPGTAHLDDAQSFTESVGELQEIVTGAGTYDPTILTKFISGAGFSPAQGVDSGVFEDTVVYTLPSGSGFACVQPGTDSGGVFTEFYAGLELPDGARIKQVVFYGEDNYAPDDIDVSLGRTTINLPSGLGVPTRTDTAVSAFTTQGHTGVIAVSSLDNLDEVVGNSGSAATGFEHRFHTINVRIVNAALANHRLCGVEVLYQVPTSAADPGMVFHPISPTRAFDSRIPVYPGAGLLAPNTSKVISIKDGHDGAGAVNAPDVVPAGATAITYNVTIAAPTGPNFVSVTPGDAAGYVASAINFNGTAVIANAGTVAIDANRQIAVWGGDQTGSAHVVIDVTGYYTPPVPFPNMGN